jgi:hypothetical protein
MISVWVRTYKFSFQFGWYVSYVEATRSKGPIVRNIRKVIKIHALRVARECCEIWAAVYYAREWSQSPVARLKRPTSDVVVEIGQGVGMALDA